MQGALTSAAVWSNICQKHFLIVFVSCYLGEWHYQKRIKVWRHITFVDTHSCSFQILLLTRRRLQYDSRMISLSFLFIWRGGQLFVAERHNHRFDFFWKLQQREGCSGARIITWIYGSVWYIRTLQTAEIGLLLRERMTHLSQVLNIVM